jgi:hypothetical protein
VSEFSAVFSVRELELLDSDEILEGYLSARSCRTEPGNNRSKSFWHGWRNGMADLWHADPDAAQAALAKDFLRVLH